MPPIDPNSLLKAFDPWLTPEGGIRNQEEVPRLSSLMKKYSRKLVSRCIYLNVLMNTKEDVLNKFLELDGWETINSWLDLAKKSENRPFLIEIIRLLERCPVSVERLKQNNTAKLVKSLSKDSDIDLATSAKILVEKWTAMINTQNSTATAASTKSSAKDIKDRAKKAKRNRDSSERQNSESDDGSGVKKLRKDEPSSEKRNNSNKDNGVGSEGFISENSSESSKLSALSVRPTTVKVKQNTSRSIGLLESGSGAAQPATAATSKSPTTPVSAVNKVPPIRIKLGKTENAAPAVVATSPGLSKLTESAGFMDAIVPESTPVARKKKKVVPLKSSEASKTGSPKKERVSPQKVDEATAEDIAKQIEMDMLTNEPVADDIAMDSQDSQPTSVHATTPSDTESRSYTPPLPVSPPTASEILPITPGPSKSYPRGCLSATKSSKKKAVRWLAEENITQVRFFDIEENERTNVYREAMTSQLTDRKGEGQAFLDKNSPSEPVAIEKFSWPRLNPITFPEGLPVLEIPGGNSNERIIQLDRQRHTLAVLYPSRDLAPDFPMEPDTFEALAADHEQPKEIPLEDVNNPDPTANWTTTSPQIATQPSPIAAFDQGLSFGVPAHTPAPFNAPDNSVGVAYGQASLGYNGGGISPPNTYAQSTYLEPTQPAQFSSTYVPQLAGHSSRPPRFQGQQFDRGGRGGRGGRGYQSSQVCRHFLKTGDCSYGDRCKYSHKLDARNVINSREGRGTGRGAASGGSSWGSGDDNQNDSWSSSANQDIGWGNESTFTSA